MGKRLYIGNLSYQTTETDLTSLFEELGPVESASVITDRDTGRSKGFAFIEMAEQDAEKAIAHLNGTDLNGRAITVNEVQVRAERSTGTRSGYSESRGLSDIQIGRLSMLKEDQKVSFGSLQLKPASEFYDIRVEEREIDGPKPIERTLRLNSQPLAKAFLDRPETEATLAWPLLSHVQLKPVLDFCLTDFWPSQSPLSSENTLEFWSGSRYYQTTIGAKPTSELVVQKLANRRLHADDSLRLLQISSENAVMELLFDESSESPVRLALVISVVRAESLARLFSRFHKNDIVRENLGAVMCAFAPDPHRYLGFKSLLHPLPIIGEV